MGTDGNILRDSCCKTDVQSHHRVYMRVYGSISFLNPVPGEVAGPGQPFSSQMRCLHGFM